MCPKRGRSLVAEFSSRISEEKYLHPVKVNEVAYKRCSLPSATHFRFLFQRSTRSSAESSQWTIQCEDSNITTGTVKSATVAEKGRIPPPNPNAPNHTSNPAAQTSKTASAETRPAPSKPRLASKLATPGSSNLSSTPLFFPVLLFCSSILFAGPFFRG